MLLQSEQHGLICPQRKLVLEDLLMPIDSMKVGPMNLQNNNNIAEQLMQIKNNTEEIQMGHCFKLPCIAINRSLPTSGGLMADVPCLDHSLDGCLGYPDDVQTMEHTRRTHTRSERARTPFWRAREPVRRPERPNSNRDARDERANRRTEHGERLTYQIKPSHHIAVILHMGIEFWVV